MSFICLEICFLYRSRSSSSSTLVVASLRRISSTLSVWLERKLPLVEPKRELISDYTFDISDSISCLYPSSLSLSAMTNCLYESSCCRTSIAYAYTLSAVSPLKLIVYFFTSLRCCSWSFRSLFSEMDGCASLSLEKNSRAVRRALKSLLVSDFSVLFSIELFIPKPLDCVCSVP